MSASERGARPSHPRGTHPAHGAHGAIQPPPPYNSLGYATAAERISGFLGPLFVRSKVDDISAIKGT